jgi:hypothetical protein
MEISDVGAEFPNLRHGAGFVLSICAGVVTMMEGLPTTSLGRKAKMSSDFLDNRRSKTTG